MEVNGFDICEAGVMPLINAFCESFDLTETINQNLPWDEKQCKLSPGDHIKALVLNILNKRTALYQVENSFREYDLELLFGPGVSPEDFNDDVLGRTLDKFYAANPKKVFSTFALKAIAKDNVDLSIIHGDTTSKVVYGQYEGKGHLNVTYGKSKDHRADLKQYICGLLTTGDGGVPLFGEVKDGNFNDKTWNKELLPQLAELMDIEELKKITYVADSALVNKSCLERIQDQKLKFISRFPHNFNLADELIEEAWAKNEWIEVGRLAKKKNSAEYKYWETRRKIYGHKYRMIVVHSTHLDGRKLKGLNKRLENRKAELQKAIKEIEKKEYACIPDAEKDLNRFLKENENRFYPLEGHVEKDKVRKKRKNRGRPRADETPEYEEKIRVRIELGELKEVAVNEERERLSCFILITNVDEEKRNGLEILKEYKRQHTVENKFKFIKNPVMVGPIYLQKKERLEALTYVVLIALLIYTILERRVRQALEKEEEPIILKGNVKSFEPTGNRILELFESVKILKIDEGGFVKRIIPNRYLKLQRLLGFAGFDMSIYQAPG